jgi:hypothetical protein
LSYWALSSFFIGIHPTLAPLLPSTPTSSSQLFPTIPVPLPLTSMSAVPHPTTAIATETCPQTPMLLDLLPPPSNHGNSSLLHYVVPILPNTSSIIEIAFLQTTLLAWVTILLHQFQIFNLLEPILTTCRVVSILPVLGALTICSHPPYQLPGHMRTPQLLYSALCRSLGSVTATFASHSTTTPK